MSTQNILDKIVAKTQDETEQLRQSGAQKQAELKAAADSALKEQREIMAAQTAAQTAEIDRRTQQMAALDGRKSALAAKRGVMDEAFAEAKNKLLSLSDTEWAALAEAWLLANTPAGDVCLRVPQQDYDRCLAAFGEQQKPASLLGILSDALMRVLNTRHPEGVLLGGVSRKLTERNGQPCRLFLEKTPAPFDGGLLLVTEKSDIDLSYGTLLAAVREQHESEVAGLLF